MNTSETLDLAIEKLSRLKADKENLTQEKELLQGEVERLSAELEEVKKVYSGYVAERDNINERVERLLALLG